MTIRLVEPKPVRILASRFVRVNTRQVPCWFHSRPGNSSRATGLDFVPSARLCCNGACTGRALGELAGLAAHRRRGCGEPQSAVNSLTDPMSNLIDPPHPQITHKDLMLATPGKLFSAAGWIYEIKYDGFRCLIYKHGDVVRLESRRERDMSDQFPELVSEIRPIAHDFVADGELVILDESRPPAMGSPAFTPHAP
jgi:hypothetical protein